MKINNFIEGEEGGRWVGKGRKFQDEGNKSRFKLLAGQCRHA